MTRILTSEHPMCGERWRLKDPNARKEHFVIVCEEQYSWNEWRKDEREIRRSVGVNKKRVQGILSRDLTTRYLRQCYRVFLIHAHTKNIIAMFTKLSFFVSFASLPKSALYFTWSHWCVTSDYYATASRKTTRYVLFMYRNIIIKISLHINYLVFWSNCCF